MAFQECWEFWIDVGGTFTDCIGRAPNNSLHFHKVLSSGVIKGRGVTGPRPNQFIDVDLRGYGHQFFRGFRLGLFDSKRQVREKILITDFNHQTGTFTLENPLKTDCRHTPISYQLNSGEEAPLIGIRKIMGLQLHEPIPKISLLLGTTIGTNALLERKGTKIGLIITKGFADLLQIGTQARADLFKLQIKKPAKLYHCVCEVDERIDALGNVL